MQYALEGNLGIAQRKAISTYFAAKVKKLMNPKMKGLNSTSTCEKLCVNQPTGFFTDINA